MTPTLEWIRPISMCTSWQGGPTCCGGRNHRALLDTSQRDDGPEVLVAPALRGRSSSTHPNNGYLPGESAAITSNPLPGTIFGNRMETWYAPSRAAPSRDVPCRFEPCGPPQKKFETHGSHTHVTADHRVGSFVSAPPPRADLRGPRLTPPLRRGPLSCPAPRSRIERLLDPLVAEPPRRSATSSPSTARTRLWYKSTSVIMRDL